MWEVHGQLRHPGVEVAGVDIAELARRSRVMEGALRDVMTTCRGGSGYDHEVPAGKGPQ